MINMYCRVLEILLISLEESFSNSSSDRKRLHDLEWGAEEDVPSILGEVEVRADLVIGIVRTFLKKKPDNTVELIKILQENSIYNSDSIVNWIAVDGNKFRKFLCYVETVESLRMSIISFLKKCN
ncbi:hypothetical protein H0A36_28920 [Endozoicomonas sp. SM1973]|uniref:Uncharacterized protein n=1 Tax=Spartinivicinus marinus TaxID=2994442 RepID=A0A853IIZ2_9GAMM|nr:hypothetical protein [Spartinivicinus marinus]MCX4030267.1 hypothetical protein [Spartinivicinus marinus]NYZ70041.1 hypothetical protein [Spartinivicinus marinus]